MQNRFMEYLTDVEGLLEKEEFDEPDKKELSPEFTMSSKEYKLVLLTTLKNIEDFCLTTHFGSVAECGEYIAKNVKGRLVYEVNNSEATQIKKNLVNEVSNHLKDYLDASKEVIKPQYQLDRHEREDIVEFGLVKVREYCIDYGFYSKALEASKILAKKFGHNELETVRRAIVGYCQRQILTGEDQTMKVENIRKNAGMGRYGKDAKQITARELKNLCDNANVIIKNKQFTINDSKKALEEHTM